MGIDRVLWVTMAYPSEGNPVPGIFYQTQAEALVRLGVQVEVVAPTPWVPWPLARCSRRWAAYRRIAERYEHGGVQIYRPRYPALPNEVLCGAPHWFMTQAIAQLGLTPPQLIHAHYAYPCGLVAGQLRRRWQIPAVLTLHGSDVNVNPTVNALTRHYFAAATSEADQVIAVSRPLAERAECLTGRLPVVLPLGIDTRRYARLPEKEAARRALHLPADAFLIVFVGNLLAAKGIRELLSALERLAVESYRAVFIGDGPLRREIDAAPRAIAVGAQPNELIPQYLAAGDVLVLPSYGEGMPTVLIEAGMAGLPVIASQVGGSADLLAGERGVLIPDHSVDALVAAIRAVRADYPAALTRTRALQTFVRHEYDVEANARKLLEIYAESAARFHRQA